MKIYAIGDTHLSGKPPFKPMKIFGAHWEDHWEKIRRSWLSQVTDEDTVLLAGDISWALKLKDALVDLEEIAALPGRKIMVRGNHDYWWQTVTKMTKAVQGKINFLHNNYALAGDYAVCGSRGWTCPQDPSFSDEDMPIYTRELARVKASLDAARADGFTRTILMLHYPPSYDQQSNSGFLDLIAEYSVEICVYGHLHGEGIATALSGNINGAACFLVSCDALDFSLKRIV